MVRRLDAGRSGSVSDGGLSNLAGRKRSGGVGAFGQQAVDISVVAVSLVVVVLPDAGLAVGDDGVCVGGCADALEGCGGVVVCFVC